MDYKSADLLFVHGDEWWDVAIEDISHSAYSHVAGFTPSGRLIEANGLRRVGYQSPEKYKGESEIYTCESLTDEQRKKIIVYVRGEIGYYYDYLLIAWEAIRYLFHWMIPFTEPYHSRDCSTLWSDAYRSVGVDLCPGIKFPSPGDLAKSKLLKKISSY